MRDKREQGLCECGCGNWVRASRSDARYYSVGCRVRASRERNADTSPLYGKDCACGRDGCRIGWDNRGGKMTQSDYRDAACKQYAYRQRKKQND